MTPTQSETTPTVVPYRERAAALRKFWFGDAAPSPAQKPRAQWFEKNPDFDRAFEEAFADDYARAASGLYAPWLATAEDAVSLVLLLDQFPRNVFRGEARAFATDAMARDMADEALARGHDARLPPVWRWFLYLPFEHSESLEDQRRSLRLFQSLGDDEASRVAIDYARRHLVIIERFGRFPHRNAALGREGTPEELAFLKEPGSSF